MTRRFIIYVVTGPGGLKYVGQTNGPLETRWRHHTSPETLSRFDDARPRGALSEQIALHGPEAFSVRALATTREVADASYLERALIIQRRTLWPLGMNRRLPRPQAEARDIMDVRRHRPSPARAA